MKTQLHRLTQFVRKYNHGLWFVVYLLFYSMGFSILESAEHRHYHVIHSVIDDMIPFVRFMIVPYLLWFIFMAAGILWFIFGSKNKLEFYRVASALCIGMTVFLIVSCVFPNMQDLRPVLPADGDIFYQLVAHLYKTDTPTNVLPSIHVFNTLVLLFAMWKSPQLRQHKIIMAGSTILSILICLSTVTLKQHSVVDASMGALMAVALTLACDRVFEDENAPAYAGAHLHRTI